MKAQYADRWKTVRKTRDRAKREEAAQALKIEQKAAYAAGRQAADRSRTAGKG